MQCFSQLALPSHAYHASNDAAAASPSALHTPSNPPSHALHLITQSTEAPHPHLSAACVFFTVAMEGKLPIAIAVAHLQIESSTPLSVEPNPMQRGYTAAPKASKLSPRTCIHPPQRLQPHTSPITNNHVQEKGHKYSGWYSSLNVKTMPVVMEAFDERGRARIPASRQGRSPKHMSPSRLKPNPSFH